VKDRELIPVREEVAIHDIEPNVRHLTDEDFERVAAVVEDWWGGRPVRGLVHRLFFEHFTDTGFVADDDGRLVAFLIGFDTQSRPGESYVHMVGVAPDARGSGLGRELYERFFDLVRDRGCSVVRAMTSPVNTASIAFHRSIGFDVEPSDDGDRVRFVRQL
jgi:GNAT superfamily N-acetyltransferase